MRTLSAALALPCAAPAAPPPAKNVLEGVDPRHGTGADLQRLISDAYCRVIKLYPDRP